VRVIFIIFVIMIEIYTDGSCLFNKRGSNNKGGCGFLVVENDKELYHYTEIEENTTNNRQELKGAILALEWAELENISNFKIKSDSTYVVKGITIWSKKWKLHNWKKSKASTKHIINVDLWKRLDELYSRNNVIFEWTKGHVEGTFNNKIDQLITKSYSDLDTPRPNLYS